MPRIKPSFVGNVGGAGRRVGSEPAERTCLSPFCKYLVIDKKTVRLVCGKTGEMSKDPDMRRSDCR